MIVRTRETRLHRVQSSVGLVRFPESGAGIDSYDHFSKQSSHGAGESGGNGIRKTSRGALGYLPHHGSNHNWVLDRPWLGAGTCCVASAGIHNSYGHPDPFLLEDVQAMLHCPVYWSNEESVVESWVRTTP